MNPPLMVAMPCPLLIADAMWVLGRHPELFHDQVDRDSFHDLDVAIHEALDERAARRA